MPESNSTTFAPGGKPTTTTNGCQSGVKPAKPYPDFPLFPHATKRWAKKIRGQLFYFGPWDDPDGALAKYLDNKTDLHAGRTPRPDATAVTVKDIANVFLVHKQSQVDAGELSPRTWRDYKETCDLLVDQLGKRRLISDLRPDDFAALRKVMTKKWGLHRVAKNVQYARSVFKHAFEAELIATPIRFGPGFKLPSKKSFRLEKAKQGEKLFTRDEVRAMLNATDGPVHAMILLGINCAFGNGDCAALTVAAVDLDRGWINFPRPKTGIPRRCPLWPETVEAIRKAIAKRPTPKNADHTGLLFVTKYGGSWGKDTSDNPVAKETAKLLHRLEINGRQGLGFYTLRHTFRTVADEGLDQVACNFIMGHGDASMAAVYRERVSDERLQAVVVRVRNWLFAGNAAAKDESSGQSG